MILPIWIVGRMSMATPSVGSDPGQATMQAMEAMAAGVHAVPSQSGQCWHGSAATVCMRAASAAGIEAKATTGNAAAKTARQLSNTARMRRRSMIR